MDDERLEGGNVLRHGLEQKVRRELENFNLKQLK